MATAPRPEDADAVARPQTKRAARMISPLTQVLKAAQRLRCGCGLDTYCSTARPTTCCWTAPPACPLNVCGWRRRLHWRGHHNSSRPPATKGPSPTPAPDANSGSGDEPSLASRISAFSPASAPGGATNILRRDRKSETNTPPALARRNASASSSASIVSFTSAPVLTSEPFDHPFHRQTPLGTSRSVPKTAKSASACASATAKSVAALSDVDRHARLLATTPSKTAGPARSSRSRASFGPIYFIWSVRTAAGDVARRGS